MSEVSDISKVAEVIGIATKKDGTELRGIGKNGKDWVMYSVILENGVKMKLFGPVKVGDIVFNLHQDEQYHDWKGEVKRQNGHTTPHDASQPTLAQIYHKLEEIETLLTGDKKTPLKQADVVVTAEEFDGEQIDISNVNIPF